MICATLAISRLMNHSQELCLTNGESALVKSVVSYNESPAAAIVLEVLFLMV